MARVADDPRLPLDRPAIEALLARPVDFTGTAGAQIGRVIERAEKIVARYPEAAATISEVRV